MAPKPLQHISFSELEDFASKFFSKNPEIRHQFQETPKAAIVFKEESFFIPYSLEARTYIFSLANKYFMPNMIGTSIFASCLSFE